MRSIARRVAAAGLVLCGLACAAPRWRSTPAERPLSRAEVGSRLLSVAPGLAPPLRDALVRALRDAGFQVVEHPPYAGDLELTLRFEGARGVATLRTDGFFVDEVEAGWPDLADPAPAAEIARGLAISDGLARFFRNSGVPAQDKFTN